MASLALQSSLATDLRSQAMLALLERLRSLDLTRILTGNVNAVPDSVLPFLAWQWDVIDSYWQLLLPLGSDGNPRRQLIQNSVALHRLRGTPSVVKTALASQGFSGVSILEGENSWGGTSWPSNEGWALVRLMVPLAGVGVSLANFPAWQSDAQYTPGDFVAFGGNYFWATGNPPIGVQPKFDTVGQVPDVGELSDFGNLITSGWVMISASAPSRPITINDTNLIAGIFNFLKPARCWLDAVYFVLPTLVDSAPVPFDKLALGDILEVSYDPVSPPTDSIGALSVALAPISDAFSPIVPLCNGRYSCKGHNCGAHQPLVADGPLVINGIIHGESA